MGNNTEHDSKNEELGLAIPMRWKAITETTTIYANNLMITHGGGEFYLIFGETVPPVILDTTVDKIPEVVDIEPVARIAVTPENIERFADAILKNIEKYRLKNDLNNDHTELNNA